MSTTNTTVVSFRVPAEILERIDHNAKREGVDRTAYILNWLPASYGGDGLDSIPYQHSNGETIRNVSLRIPHDTLERIDQSCQDTNTSRSDYILTWLIENYEQSPDAHDLPTLA
jgi:predicted DNA-binding protein